MKTITINRTIIKADAFEEIAMHPDLPIILFTSGDLYYENILQIPLTFRNRFFAREAMERMELGTEEVDLSDLECEWPEAAAEQITRYLSRQKEERNEYEAAERPEVEQEKYRDR